jgi:hypothetical protein
MVFIKLARVSEIPTPHKFDRSIYFFSTSENPAFLCIFALKIVIFLLLPCKTQKH